MEAFPLLKNDILIWQSPKGGTLYRKGEKILDVNLDALKILVRLDGTKNIDDIVNELTDKCEYRNDNLVLVKEFLFKLETKGFLEFSEYSHPRVVNVIGSLSEFYPIHINIELTERCNFSCRYCYNSSSPNKTGEISEPIALLSILRDLGARLIQLTGGEPLMHPLFEDILDYSVKNFDLVGVITNGSLITRKLIRGINQNRDKIVFQVCLDSSNPNELDTIAGINNAFQSIINGIEILKEFNMIYRIGMVLDSPNRINDIENVLLISKNLGAKAFIVSPVIDYGRGQPLAREFSPENTKRLWDKLLLLSEKYKPFFMVERNIADSSRVYNCGSGYQNMTIRWNNNISYCLLADTSVAKFDSSNELVEIWDNFQKLFSFFSTLNAPNLDCCKNCEYIYYCLKCIVRGLKKAREIGISNCSWANKIEPNLKTLNLI